MHDRNICLPCYRAQQREYMRRKRGSTRLHTSWAGIECPPHVKAYARQEARERGVPVEAVIQEWGLQP
jgi:hypothetical protein